MRLAACLILVPVLAGCNVHKTGAHGDENVTINASDNGEVTFNVPYASGQIKLPEGMMHDGDFDIDGVKLMPGSQVTGFNVNAHDKGATVNLSFTAAASPDQVRSYFLDEFKKKGVEATATGDGISGESEDGDPFVIGLKPAASGSQGTIVIQSKD